MTLTTLYQCANNNALAQRQLFEQYGKLWFSVAYRYLRNTMEAEDITADAFVKIVRNVAKGSFESIEKFEAWARRIVVNEALMLLRRRSSFHLVSESEAENIASDEDLLSNYAVQEILELVRSLPEGYKVVFNLYVVEGYNHKEIGELLGINEGTSKSQLSKAKALLKKKLNQQYEYDHRTEFLGGTTAPATH
jgi:RNA polymerase sigma factor (sigma-70 family)